MKKACPEALPVEALTSLGEYLDMRPARGQPGPASAYDLVLAVDGCVHIDEWRARIL